METKSLNVVERLLLVMGEIGAIGKNRKAPGLNYAFRGIDDILPDAQALCVKHGVLHMPRVLERERETVTTRGGAPMVSVRLLIEHTFRAPDGSSVVAVTLGEAMDSGDKATNKAHTAALKLALTEGLLIPTHEADRDTEEHSPEIAAPAKTRAPVKPTAKPDLAPDPVGIEIEAVIAAAARVTPDDYETLRVRAKKLDGVASPAEYTRVAAAMAKRKGELSK